MSGISPDYSKTDSFKPKQVLASTNNVVFDGTFESDIGVIEPGACVGQKTSDNLFEQVVKAELVADASSGDSSFEVDTLEAVRLADTLILDYQSSDEEEVDVSSLNSESSEVTISGTLSNTQASGTAVRTKNGTEDAVGIYVGTEPIDTEDSMAIFPKAVQAVVEEDKLENFDDVAKSQLEDDFVFE